jgi:plastocyanin
VAEVTERDERWEPFEIREDQSLPFGEREEAVVKHAARIWVGLVLVAVVTTILLIAPVGATDTTIKVGDDYYKPKKVTVVVGDKVTWKWVGSAVHNVTVARGPKKFHSKDKSSGKYSKVVTEPGTYSIVCTLHSGMKMKLIVEPAPPPTTTTAPPAP